MESPLLEKGSLDLFKITNEMNGKDKQMQIDDNNNNTQPVTENDLYNDLYPFSNFIKNNMIATSNNIVDVDITGKQLCPDVFSDF